MNSRERVLAAVNHKEADRLPIDFGAMRSTGIAAIAYNNLLKKSGKYNGEARMYDFQQQLAYPGEDIRNRFHIDAIDAGQAFLLRKEDWKNWTLNDGSNCLVPGYLNLEVDDENNVFLKNNAGIVVGTKPKNSLYTDQCFWPYGELEAIPEDIREEEMSNNMWSVPCPPFHLDIINSNEDYSLFTHTVKEFYKQNDQAVMLSIGHSFLEFGQFIRRIDNFLMDIYIDKKGVARLLDKLLDGYMMKLEKILGGVKNSIDIIQFGDDLGIQTGPWMDPEIIKELFIPRYAKLWRYVHDNSDCKVFMHSCGSIYKLLPGLIDIGLDIINPVQTGAADMDPVRLKAEFGKDLTFWGGGCDTQGVLSKGTPEEVKDDVKKRIDIFAPGGGFVFNQIHNILADVPPENIVAMFETAYEYGKY